MKHPKLLMKLALQDELVKEKTIAELAGQKIRIIGTLDPETYIIQVKTIEKQDHSC